jgi:hypothetical protein
MRQGTRLDSLFAQVSLLHIGDPDFKKQFTAETKETRIISILHSTLVRSIKLDSIPWIAFSQVRYPGANPTTLSYNVSVVKIYSTTNSMALFYNKNCFSLTLKR